VVPPSASAAGGLHDQRGDLLRAQPVAVDHEVVVRGQLLVDVVELPQVVGPTGVVGGDRLGRGIGAVVASGVVSPALSGVGARGR
jgi:hypothetical protein